MAAPCDFQKLPSNLKEALLELENELLEGDITEKGYWKKRARILAQYCEDIDETYRERREKAVKCTLRSDQHVIHPQAITATTRRLDNPENQSREVSDKNSKDLADGGRPKSSNIRISAKIQQLVNTLKRPKKKPICEYYEDDQNELEVHDFDPDAPVPQGGISVPACGEQILPSPCFCRSLEQAIERYGTSLSRSNFITILDEAGKVDSYLTYGKLLSRSRKIAYNLVARRFGERGEPLAHRGDRVALVYSNSDPVHFTAAFFGCLLVGVVPVSVDMPTLSKSFVQATISIKDWILNRTGVLLEQTEVKLALTSESVHRCLPWSADGITIKGWPSMNWFVTEHLSRPTKDWLPAYSSISEGAAAYLEPTILKDGNIAAVTVTRGQLLSHCQTLAKTCGYCEGDLMVSTVDFQRMMGLWHMIQVSAYTGMQNVFVPLKVIKTNPLVWLQAVTKYQATIAITKSKHMHGATVFYSDRKDHINLSTLRMILIEDGANPWYLSTYDAFVNCFSSSAALKPNVLCSCASSPECLTVSIRRPDAKSTGRGILSIAALSHNVVRVEAENSLASVIVQDVGYGLPGSIIGVIKASGLPKLCQTDEIGEIIVCAKSTASSYWGMPGISTNVFKVSPLGSDGRTIGSNEFVKSGLFGFLGPGGLIFVIGSRRNVISAGDRRTFFADDLVATILAVEAPFPVNYNRIAVFSIKVLKQERIVVIFGEEASVNDDLIFHWMSKVLQAVDNIHKISIYCVAFVPIHHLPKDTFGVVDIHETRRLFLDGLLHPTNVLVCPHSCISNLPKPRENYPEISPGAVLAGTIVQGMRLAEASGSALEYDSDSSRSQFLRDYLKKRALLSPDHILFTFLNSRQQEISRISCLSLHKRSERIASTILSRYDMRVNDRAIIYLPSASFDFIAAFYGCLYIGSFPANRHDFLKATLSTSRVKLIITSSSFSKQILNVSCDSRIPISVMEIEDLVKKKFEIRFAEVSCDDLCYIDFSVSSTGVILGSEITHSVLMHLCRSVKLACELYPSREVALCLDPTNGLSLLMWIMIGVFAGHHSILIPLSELIVNPSLWVQIVSSNKVRDSFLCYSALDIMMRMLKLQINELQLLHFFVELFKMTSQDLFILSKPSDKLLQRSCVIVSEERPRVTSLRLFIQLFQNIGLNPRAVSTSVGCRCNIALCLQGPSDPDLSSVFIDLRALRNNRISVVERGSPHSVCIMESGKLLPGIKVVVSNPETKGQCADSRLGELWVRSLHNTSAIINMSSIEDIIQEDVLHSFLVTGDTENPYARTGLLGFIRRSEDLSPDSVPHDGVFIIGTLDEALIIRGMRYYPSDIEETVIRCNVKNIPCCLLVIVIEWDAPEAEALDLVPMVTNAVLEEHYLITGVVVLVDPGIIPCTQGGEKLRFLLRDAFLSDQLNPFYVAYNM